MFNHHWLPISNCKCKDEHRVETKLALCNLHDDRVIRAIRAGTIRTEFTPTRSAGEAEVQVQELTASGPPEITVPAGFGEVTITRPIPGTKIRCGGITLVLK